MRNSVVKTPNMLDIRVTSAKNSVRSVREHSANLIIMASAITFVRKIVELLTTITAKHIKILNQDTS